MENVIQKCIRFYYKYGARSNKKLIKLHSFIKESTEKRLDDKKYKFFSLPGKEYNVKGKFYNKKVDICVKDTLTKTVRGCISVKFVMSNYKQNSNNYFENTIGENYNLKSTNLKSSNLKSSNGIKTWYILVIFDKIPYFDREGKIVRYDTLSKEDNVRYNKLKEDGLLDYLSIIKLSGGRYLKSPRITNIINTDRFKILDSNFEEELEKFCKDIETTETSENINETDDQ